MPNVGDPGKGQLFFGVENDGKLPCRDCKRQVKVSDRYVVSTLCKRCRRDRDWPGKEFERAWARYLKHNP